jgi:hypothetical protein
VGAETRLKANDTGWNALESPKHEPLDLPPERDLALRVEANEVEDIFANVDADGSKRTIPISAPLYNGSRITGRR